MVNLLDRAFGDGAGTVIAPTEEVAYSNDTWHSEGISGLVGVGPGEAVRRGSRHRAEGQVRQVGEARPQQLSGGHRRRTTRARR